MILLLCIAIAAILLALPVIGLYALGSMGEMQEELNE